MAAAVVDPGEYLWSIRNEPRFSTDFKSSPNGPVAYHAPCHLRAQGVGFRGRELLRKLPGVVPTTVAECCGHDGTWAMKTEGFVHTSHLVQPLVVDEPEAVVSAIMVAAGSDSTPTEGVQSLIDKM